MARLTQVLLTVIFGCIALSPTLSAQTRTYPDRTIRIITGNSAGSQSDQLARLLSDYLSREWAQAVVVDNRAGAGGTIAAETVAHAPADGYTLLLGGQSNLVLAAMPGNQLRYDPTKDFAPIGRIARVPLGLVVHSSNPAKTVPELVALAKSNPGRLTYGASGLQGRLAGELFKIWTGSDIVEIPYKGMAPLLVDLVAGRIDMTFCDLSLVTTHVKAGSLRLLATAGQRRPAGAASVATVAEQGIEGFRVEPWYGLVAPAGTPSVVLTKLKVALAEFRRSPETGERLKNFGYDPIEDSADEFDATISSEIDEFAALFKRTGLKLKP